MSGTIQEEDDLSSSYKLEVMHYINKQLDLLNSEYFMKRSEQDSAFAFRRNEYLKRLMSLEGL